MNVSRKIPPRVGTCYECRAVTDNNRQVQVRVIGTAHRWQPPAWLCLGCRKKHHHEFRYVPL